MDQKQRVLEPTIEDKNKASYEKVVRNYVEAQSLNKRKKERQGIRKEDARKGLGEEPQVEAEDVRRLSKAYMGEVLVKKVGNGGRKLLNEGKTQCGNGDQARNDKTYARFYQNKEDSWPEEDTCSKKKYEGKGQLQSDWGGCSKRQHMHEAQGLYAYEEEWCAHGITGCSVNCTLGEERKGHSGVLSSFVGQQRTTNLGCENERYICDRRDSGWDHECAPNLSCRHKTNTLTHSD
ncbi:hypothetical protein VNO78_01368 [Psophocarpus tetragonolobus]|uniref:Uncharacterized protein n=1 Tax=Psophocarpus tetragonolobus TaxID=3891 RepID=A0AAN9TAC8_PSOTE